MAKDRSIIQTLRLLQFLQMVTILAGPIPPILAKKSAESHPVEFDLPFPEIAGSLGSDYVVALISIGLVLMVRRVKYGPHEDDWLQLFFFALVTAFASVLMIPLSLVALPIVIFVIGLCNIIIAGRKIRDLKLTSNPL